MDAAGESYVCMGQRGLRELPDDERGLEPDLLPDTEKNLGPDRLRDTE